MKFIVFEGLDGSGKSTLMGKLKTHLEAESHPVVTTREPGGTPLGDEIRNLILRTSGDAPTARCELLLYEASRAQHVEKMILPALHKGHWVLCDRYTASSIAFQGGGRNLSLQQVEWLNDFATQSKTADLTVLLDLTEEESRKRRLHREKQLGQEPDRIESEARDFHQRVRQGFLSQASKEPQAWLVLDAAGSAEDLFQTLLAELRQRGWLK